MAATQYVNVNFSGTDSQSASWSNLGGTQYVFAGVQTTDGSTMGATLTNVTSTGATVNAFAPFNGKVTLEIATQ